MKIILTRDEYNALRPNHMALEFVEKIRAILAKGPVGSDWPRLVEDIKESLKGYDKNLKRANDDDNFQLWPSVHDESG
jgi:hypothetical protein